MMHMAMESDSDSYSALECSRPAPKLTVFLMFLLNPFDKFFLISISFDFGLGFPVPRHHL